VTAADDRVARLTEALARSIVGWRFESVVAALQALRGIDQISAIGLVAEIGDIGRFAHPRQLMGYLGLVPANIPVVIGWSAAVSPRPAMHTRGDC